VFFQLTRSHFGTPQNRDKAILFGIYWRVRLFDLSQQFRICRLIARRLIQNKTAAFQSRETRRHPTSIQTKKQKTNPGLVIVKFEKRVK
jgi:hypothetical protein